MSEENIMSKEEMLSKNDSVFDDEDLKNSVEGEILPIEDIPEDQILKN